MIYHFTTNTTIHAITVFMACCAVILLWKFRDSREVRFLIYLELFVAIWAFSYAFEFANPDLDVKILWSKISYFGIAFLPVCYFLFASAFSQKRKIITTKIISLLLIIPIITILLVFTNEKHLLIWSSVTLDPVHNIAIYKHGIGFWVFYFYTETLLIAGLYYLATSIYKHKNYYKSQIVTILVASLIPIIGNFIYVANLNPFPGFDWTPVSFVLTGLVIIFGIFRFRMFNIIPLARTKLFEILNEGVIVTNAEGFIEDCNSVIYSIFNWQKNTIIREPFETVFKKYNTLVDGLASNMASIQLEVKNNNQKQCYHIKISPIYRNKKLTGHILLFHDITSMVNAEEELRNTNKKLIFEIEKREKLIEDLDAFAHTVAHDLRSSLSSIFSASEIMEEIINVNDKNLLCELSNLINHSANKSIQITHELLLMATTDKTDVDKKQLDMSLIYNESKRQLSDIIKNSNAKFTEPLVWPKSIGYAPWIEEVWSNYLSNAIKYGGTPPEIEVGADVLLDGKVKFWITDNGKGLSAEQQKLLFKNFVRLHPQNAEGYGLGLSIVKKIIEKLDGSAGVESKGIGQGSKFYFILPTGEENAFNLNNINAHKELMVN